MKNIKFERYYLLTLVYIPIVIIFELLEKFIIPKYAIYCFIDSLLPFVPEFSVFYFVWFIYMFVATAYFMFTSKEDFLKLTAFISIGMMISFVIFVIFPNEQNLRPEYTGTGIFGALVAWLYEIDTNTNVCPSIHVLNSVGVHISIVSSREFSPNRLVKAVSLFTMIMINLSTMLIKQHSVIDVFFGLLFSTVMYVLVYKALFKRIAIPLRSESYADYQN